MNEPALRVNLSVDYPGKPGALRNVQLDLFPGQIAGLVGESGSGKSTLALAILRLLDTRKARVSGSISLAGADLMRLSEREMRRIRGRHIGLVLQSASSSLNPALRIGTQLREVWRTHATGSWSEGRRQTGELLERMGLPGDDRFLERYPGEVSVGQAQRLLISMAVMHRPAVVIADEPTSALDAVTQSSVLRLFRDLADRHGLAILFISHDLPSVASICNSLLILRHGAIVESGPCETVFRSAADPYTRELIAAIPVPDFHREYLQKIS